MIVNELCLKKLVTGNIDIIRRFLFSDDEENPYT